MSVYFNMCRTFFFFSPSWTNASMFKANAKNVSIFLFVVVVCSSPDNDAAKQNELDKYFMQTALPSPWPASAQSRPAKTAPPTRPLKHVSFIPPTTTCKSYSKLPCLICSCLRGERVRGSNTVLTLYGSQHIPLYVLCC